MTDGEGPCCGDPKPSGRSRYSVCNNCGAECGDCGGCGERGWDEGRCAEARQQRYHAALEMHEYARQRQAEER